MPAATIQTATLDQSVTVQWSDGSNFNGFLLLGLVLPSSGGSAWAEVDLGTAPPERIPIFQKVAIVNGQYDNSVGVLYTTSLQPPNVKYAAWFYDTSIYPPRKIAGPSASLFTVTTPTLTPTVPTLTAPTAGTVAPVPD